MTTVLLVLGVGLLLVLSVVGNIVQFRKNIVLKDTNQAETKANVLQKQIEVITDHSMPSTSERLREGDY